jgi:hypothetical protein
MTALVCLALTFAGLVTLALWLDRRLNDPDPLVALLCDDGEWARLRRAVDGDDFDLWAEEMRAS